jgi:hypothetical protein
MRSVKPLAPTVFACLAGPGADDRVVRTWVSEV